MHPFISSLILNPSTQTSPTYWQDPDIGEYSKGHSVIHDLSCKRNPGSQLVHESYDPEHVQHFESQNVQKP